MTAEKVAVLLFVQHKKFHVPASVADLRTVVFHERPVSPSHLWIGRMGRHFKRHIHNLDHSESFLQDFAARAHWRSAYMISGHGPARDWLQRFYVGRFLARHVVSQRPGHSDQLASLEGFLVIRDQFLMDWRDRITLRRYCGNHVVPP